MRDFMGERGGEIRLLLEGDGGGKIVFAAVFWLGNQ